MTQVAEIWLGLEEPDLLLLNKPWREFGSPLFFALFKMWGTCHFFVISRGSQESILRKWEKFIQFHIT